MCLGVGLSDARGVDSGEEDVEGDEGESIGEVGDRGRCSASRSIEIGECATSGTSSPVRSLGESEEEEEVEDREERTDAKEEEDVEAKGEWSCF